MAERLTTIEATSRLCWHLALGEGLTTAQAAELIGYTRSSAWRLLSTLSRYWPIFQDDEGMWQLICLGDEKIV
jgi:DNA-binding IclR family transcriptional regulator